jgi:hypothetical protein
MKNKTLVVLPLLFAVSVCYAGGRPIRPILNPQRPPATSQPQSGTGSTCAALKAVGGGWWFPPCMR